MCIRDRYVKVKINNSLVMAFADTIANSSDKSRTIKQKEDSACAFLPEDISEIAIRTPKIRISTQFRRRYFQKPLISSTIENNLTLPRVNPVIGHLDLASLDHVMCNKKKRSLRVIDRYRDHVATRNHILDRVQTEVRRRAEEANRNFNNIVQTVKSQMQDYERKARRTRYRERLDERKKKQHQATIKKLWGINDSLLKSNKRQRNSALSKLLECVNKSVR
eukprot:TRINITY_DN2254_c0_g1_i9.p1 TRINITY_DN2254_c0_g1~~TRINITY_DN2254_c0_g1_i9.p1  ORF type:complete len:221 (+),score=28.56 TRINITY_DN2254_c0_g1_i9:73-735(+)